MILEAGEWDHSLMLFPNYLIAVQGSNLGPTSSEGQAAGQEIKGIFTEGHKILH